MNNTKENIDTDTKQKNVAISTPSMTDLMKMNQEDLDKYMSFTILNLLANKQQPITDQGIPIDNRMDNYPDSKNYWDKLTIHRDWYQKELEKATSKIVDKAFLKFIRQWSVFKPILKYIIIPIVFTMLALFGIYYYFWLKPYIISNAVLLQSMKELKTIIETIQVSIK